MLHTPVEISHLNHSPWALAFKRLIDVVTALFALFLVFPLLLIIAIAVKISSSGPVFYRGLRTGYKGKEFLILKFRTMVLDAESRGGPTTGTADPRVTAVGKILRKTKIDELPQFINVLLGNMSLVGPRPEVPEYTKLYMGDEQLILAMRPGITDYASIEFADLDDRVGHEDPDAYFRKHILPRKNELRVQYVRNWSLRGDIKILWRTIVCVVNRVKQK